GHAHVDDVARLEVDLGGRSGAFEDDDLLLRSQRRVALTDDGHELFDAPLVILRSGEPSPYLSTYDDLRGHVSGRLEEDGVHMDRGGNASGLGLQSLGASNLQALPGRCRVERHVLRFE